MSVEKRNFKERKSLCVAILPLKSGKIVVAVAWLFLYCCHIFGSAIMFKPPNGKPFGY
ncbi:hypothetical protein [Ruminococcus sp.]|uniref:hypothetical protein n=1 Tax=Ruminococcus sp. TaxID=41978 RepID=UPI003AEF6029